MDLQKHLRRAQDAERNNKLRELCVILDKAKTDHGITIEQLAKYYEHDYVTSQQELINSRKQRNIRHKRVNNAMLARKGKAQRRTTLLGLEE